LVEEYNGYLEIEKIVVLEESNSILIPGLLNSWVFHLQTHTI